MRILAIDTSCDDTAVAISEDLKILSNVSWTKLKTHEKWKGVMPSEAKRQHKELLNPAINEALNKAKLKMEGIDAIAVTQGPGLAIALEQGISKAKELSKKYNKPLIAINHMIGHIYANLARDKNGHPLSGIKDFQFPLLALTVSGGHTDLYIMKGHLQFKQIGQTLDDAIGEAFDKVGRMLGMGFPAGAKIESASQKGYPDTYNFPRPLAQSEDYNWSFSGLKTAVLYQIKKILGEYKSKPGKKAYKLDDASKRLDQQTINDVAASFQEAATDSIVKKVKKAVEEHNPKMLVVGGGVIANSHLRKALTSIGVKTYYPPMDLCTDNAAMIAMAAHYYAKDGLYVKDLGKLDRIPSMNIDAAPD